MFDKLEDLLIRYEEIMGELSSPGIADNQARFRKLMKEQADLAPIVDAYKQYKQAKQDVEDSLALLDEEIIAGIVQLVEMVVEKFSPSLYAALGIFLPLIAVNCAIMGASLFMQQRILMDPANTQAITSVWDSIVYAVGSGLGWTLAIVLMGAIREKMQYCDVPKPLQGLGITFITVGLMAMAMLCFSGLKI